MIHIQPVSWDNIELHYAWNNDPELNYFDSDFPHEQESFDEFTRRLRSIQQDERSSIHIMEIIHEADQKLIGIVDIHEIDRVNLKCQIECTIADKAYENKGFGTQAFQQAVRYCFDEMGMHKVMSSAFDFNEKWIRILKNLGFTQEGCLREHALKNESYCDKYVFGLLQEEYAAMSFAHHQ